MEWKSSADNEVIVIAGGEGLVLARRGAASLARLNVDSNAAVSLNIRALPGTNGPMTLPRISRKRPDFVAMSSSCPPVDFCLRRGYRPVNPTAGKAAAAQQHGSRDGQPLPYGLMNGRRHHAEEAKGLRSKPQAPCMERQLVVPKLHYCHGTIANPRNRDPTTGSLFPTIESPNRATIT